MRRVEANDVISDEGCLALWGSLGAQGQLWPAMLQLIFGGPPHQWSIFSTKSLYSLNYPIWHWFLLNSEKWFPWVAFIYLCFIFYLFFPFHNNGSITRERKTFSSSKSVGHTWHGWVRDFEKDTLLMNYDQETLPTLILTLLIHWCWNSNDLIRHWVKIYTWAFQNCRWPCVAI